MHAVYLSWPLTNSIPWTIIRIPPRLKTRATCKGRFRSSLRIYMYLQAIGGTGFVGRNGPGGLISLGGTIPMAIVYLIYCRRCMYTHVESLNSYTRDPSKAGNVVSPCIDQSMEEDYIPKSQRLTTPIFLGATAGMRLVRYGRCQLCSTQRAGVYSCTYMYTVYTGIFHNIQF